jgi:hypothetical protein
VTKGARRARTAQLLVWPPCCCCPRDRKSAACAQARQEQADSVGSRLAGGGKDQRNAPVSPRLQRMWAAMQGRMHTGSAMPAVHSACGGNVLELIENNFHLLRPPSVRLSSLHPPHGFACHGPGRRCCLPRAQCASEPQQWHPGSCGWRCGSARECDPPHGECLCSAEHTRAGWSRHQRRSQAT